MKKERSNIPEDEKVECKQKFEEMASSNHQFQKENRRSLQKFIFKTGFMFYGFLLSFSWFKGIKRETKPHFFLLFFVLKLGIFTHISVLAAVSSMEI